MKRLQASLRFMYRCMLAGYPARTRSEFAGEMLHVYDQCVAYKTEQGVIALILFFLRELRDWPLALIAAYRSEFRLGLIDRVQAASGFSVAFCIGSEVAMSTSDEIGVQYKKRSLLIALPPLLLGLGIMLSAMIRTDVWYRLPTWQLYLSVGVTLLPGVVVALVGLLALVRRIPDWGITWLGSAFMGFVLTAQVILGELVDDGTIELAPAVEITLALVFFLSGLALLLVLAARGWSRSGLFTLAAAATMGLSLVQAVTAAPFSRDDLALLAGPVGLVFALFIYIYCRKANLGRIVVLGLTALLNIILVGIMAQAVSSWSMAAEAVSFVPPLLILITGLLAAGPLSGLVMKPILRRWA